MRKIINRIGLIATLMTTLSVYSCISNNKKSSNEGKTDPIPAIDNIVAIGKVVPAQGWIQISSPISGTINEVLVKEGDEVKQDQVLISLKENTAVFDVAQAKIQLENLQMTHQINQKDLLKEEIILNDLKSKYETSKSLFDKNAETKETVDSDFSNYKQQIQRIASLKKQILANSLSEKEQKIAIEKSQQDLKDFKIVASKNGIITDLEAEVGQAVSSNVQLGKMLDNTKSLVEGEVDEMFADSIQVGQQVELTLVGKSSVIAKGRIIYVSPTLVNKSILFETANEAEDRRVRKIKIEPDSTSNLLINSKVECRIILK